MTLQHHAKLRIDNHLRNVKLELEEISSLTTTDTSHNHYDQSNNNGERKKNNYDDDKHEWKEIDFPPFDLSKNFISFSNDDTRISTVVYIITCHFDNSELLKILLSRASSNSSSTNPNDSIHFVLYGIIQYTSPTTYRQQILQNNQSLYKLVIISIFNITTTVIHSKLNPEL